MSRVAKNPIKLPSGVDLNISGSQLNVKGPKGNLTVALYPGISFDVIDGEYLVKNANEKNLAMAGTFRALVSNMVTGVSTGFGKTLDISGVGFKAAVHGSNLLFTLGFSHPIVFPLPQGIKATVDAKQTQVVIKGIDKQLVGQVAANLRGLKEPEPYKGKGIKYSTEIIQRKEGKAGKGGK